MALQKKGALLMLIAILLWTAAPALACLSEGNMRAEHDCCAVMQTCDTTMTTSCCQLAPRNSTPAVASEYSPEHDQQPGLLSQALFLSSSTYSKPTQTANLSVLPDSSAGRSSVLRI